MHWMRKPRLNSAVATVAVETVFSLLRVASLSFDIVLYPSCPSFRSASAERANPESRGSGFALCAPRNDVSLINHRFSDGCAKAGFQEIEITAFIGLTDVARKHPAIAALE